MCFTINIRTTRSAIAKKFDADASALFDFDFRYFYRAFDNPLIPVISQDDPGRIQIMQWGLIPHWVKDEGQAASIRKGTYNARAESLTEKPSFRKAYAERRCLVIVTGFFEWQHTRQQKIPWFIQHKDEQIMALGGVADRWLHPSTGNSIHSFSIVTVHANPLLAKIHNTKKRMPLILGEESAKAWLDQDHLPEYKATLMKPFDEALLKAHTVRNQLSGVHDPHESSVTEPYSYPRDQTLF